MGGDSWLAAVTFIPVVISIVRLSQIKGWVWPSVLLAAGNLIFVVAGNTFRSPTLTGIRWAFLAAFFALTAAGLGREFERRKFGLVYFLVGPLESVASVPPIPPGE